MLATVLFTAGVMYIISANEKQDKPLRILLHILIGIGCIYVGVLQIKG